MKPRVFQVLTTVKGKTDYWHWFPIYQGRMSDCINFLSYGTFQGPQLYSIQEACQ